MKDLLCFALLLSAFACTVASRETSSMDSLAMVNINADTSAYYGDEEMLPEANAENSKDTSQLSSVFDEQLALATSEASKYYIVTVSVNQYEGGSTSTWYFNKEVSPVYFNQAWSYEGNEGITTMVIRDGVVICIEESENHSTDKWCADTGGTRSEWSEGDTVSLLGADYAAVAKEEFERNLAVLKSILKDGEIVSKNDNVYTVRIESTIDVGEEVTESSEVEIPKVVYDELM